MASATATTTSANIMSTPRTPISGAKKVTATETPSPGNWKHPRMAEIARRRKASTFDSSNILRIACNVVAFLGSFVAFPLLRSYLPFLLSIAYHLTSFLGSYQLFPLHLLRLVFLYNVYQAFHPLWRGPDSLSDIPLTPSQRRLLGLDPGSGKPNTPKTEYVTPPKYKRSTPRSQSPAWSQSRPGSASSAQMAQGGGFSPSGSPLWGNTAKREISSDFAGERLGGSMGARQSGLGFDSSVGSNASPSRDSLRESSGIWVPSTPTPSNRATGASVGLNSKWLYERGRSSSGSRRNFGGL